MTSSDFQRSQELAHQLTNSLARFLRELNRDVEHRVHELLRQSGYPDISPAHTAVFANLGLGAVRVTELAIRAQVSQQAMGKMLKELERMGYLTRGVDASDKRARDIRLTEPGGELLAATVAAAAEVRALYAAKIGEAELQELEERLRSACQKFDLGGIITAPECQPTTHTPNTG